MGVEPPVMASSGVPLGSTIDWVWLEYQMPLVAGTQTKWTRCQRVRIPPVSGPDIVDIKIPNMCIQVTFKKQGDDNNKDCDVLTESWEYQTVSVSDPKLGPLWIGENNRAAAVEAATERGDNTAATAIAAQTELSECSLVPSSEGNHKELPPDVYAVRLFSNSGSAPVTKLEFGSHTDIDYETMEGQHYMAQAQHPIPTAIPEVATKPDGLIEYENKATGQLRVKYWKGNPPTDYRDDPGL